MIPCPYFHHVRILAACHDFYGVSLPDSSGPDATAGRRDALRCQSWCESAASCLSNSPNNATETPSEDRTLTTKSYDPVADAGRS